MDRNETLYIPLFCGCNNIVPLLKINNEYYILTGILCYKLF